MRVALLLTSLLFAGCSSVATTERDFTPLFGGTRGTFVLLDPQTERVVVHDRARARTRFLPASTFKVPNTIIALETDVASGPEFTVSRNEETAPRQSWWPASWLREHTLRTALRDSVVWFYQEIARRVGEARMRDYVRRFRYGNRLTAGGIDQFWLTGGLRISAEEQTEFLRRFYFGELGVSDRTTELVKELLVLERADDYILSGKTGWAGLGQPDAPQIGWFVGYLERAGRVYVFAMNIDIRNPSDAAARSATTKAILRELGLMHTTSSGANQ